MALERAAVGALSHAELVDLVVRQSEIIDRLQATIVEQQALIARLEARVRDLEEQRDRDAPAAEDRVAQATGARVQSGPGRADRADRACGGAVSVLCDAPGWRVGRL